MVELVGFGFRRSILSNCLSVIAERTPNASASNHPPTSPWGSPRLIGVNLTAPPAIMHIRLRMEERELRGVRALPHTRVSVLHMYDNQPINRQRGGWVSQSRCFFEESRSQSNTLVSGVPGAVVYLVLRFVPRCYPKGYVVPCFRVMPRSSPLPEKNGLKPAPKLPRRR